MAGYKKRVIALGFFDGVHIGHSALLEKAMLRAGELDAVPTVMTFDEPPAATIVGEKTPLLNTPEDRSEIIRRIFGIDDVIFLHFDEKLMQMPWYEFYVRLINEFNAVGLVAGHDYHFGYRGQGNPERLLAKCRESGISCDIIDRVTYEGITVSSTYIRTLVAQGEMEAACEFLGHPHCFTGVVRSGYRFGRTIGFPTINLRIPEGVLSPAKGVYATKIIIPPKNREYFAVTNVGIRPTFGGNSGVSVESFLLDFDEELYGRRVRVDFYSFLRPEIRFPGPEHLKDQIARDVEAATEFFETGC